MRNEQSGPRIIIYLNSCGTDFSLPESKIDKLRLSITFKLSDWRKLTKHEIKPGILMSLGCTWANLVSPKCTSRNLVSLKCTCRNLVSLKCTSRDLVSLKCTCRNLVSPKCTCRDLVSLNCTSRNLVSL